MTNFLSEEERHQLIIQHRSEKNGRVRDRIKAVLLCDKGWSRKKIAQALLIDEETARRHINEYQVSKKLHLNSGGSQPMLTREQSQSFIKHLEKYTYVKVADICRYVEETYGVKYSLSGMTFWLYRNKFSFKKPKPTPYKASVVKQEAFLEIYRGVFKLLPNDCPVEFGDLT